MGIFLKMHRISKNVNWLQVGLAFLIGMSFQAVALDYSESGNLEIPYFESLAEKINSTNLGETGFTGVGLRELALNPEKYEGEEVTVRGQKALGEVIRTEKGANIAYDCSQFNDAIALTTGETYTMTGKIRSKDEYSGFNFETGETEYTKEYYLYCTEPPR